MFIFTFPICRLLIEAASSLTEFGDMGGESDGGDTGGDPFAKYESKPRRLGDPSNESLIRGLVGKTRSWSGV